MVDKLEDRSMIAYFIGYPKESMRYYFYFSQDHSMIVSQNIILLEKQFIQDGSSGRLVKLEKKVSDKQRAIDPQEPIIHEPVVDVPPSPRRSSRVSRPSERHMGMLTEKVKKIFLMRDKSHGDDLNILGKVMSNIDFEK